MPRPFRTCELSASGSRGWTGRPCRRGRGSLHGPLVWLCTGPPAGQFRPSQQARQVTGNKGTSPSWGARVLILKPSEPLGAGDGALRAGSARTSARLLGRAWEPGSRGESGMRGFPASLPQPPRGSQTLTQRHQETAAVWAQREHGARTHLPHRQRCRPGNLLRVARSCAGFKTVAPGRPPSLLTPS